MKILHFPVLAPSVHRDGILLHLKEAYPDEKVTEEEGAKLYQFLDYYLDPVANRYLNWPPGSVQPAAKPTSLLAAAEDFVRPQMRVKDTGEIGEVIYAAGETMYLWIDGQTRAYPLDKLEYVRR